MTSLASRKPKTASPQATSAPGPYPRMKDSGTEWLGQVPAHWNIERLKRSLVNVAEQTAERPGSGAVIALENVESWTGRVTHAAPGTPFDSQLKRFQAGDLLFGKLRPYLAKVTRPSRAGLCVGEFFVLRPRRETHEGPYFERLLRAKPVLDAVAASTSGARMPRANWQFMGAMPVVRPPLAEQTAIVRFLDYVDRRIRRYIRAKEKLMALLEEQNQSVIHQAVTGQIDVRTGRPYPAYKDSGVEWLGKVPEHWERRRLKSILRVVDRRSSTGAETLLSLRRDHGIVIYAEHFSRPPQGKSLVGFKLVATDQLVVNRLQANNGLVFRSSLDGLVSPDYSVFKAKSPVQMQYLSDLLRTVTYRANFRRQATGLGTGTAGFLRLYDDKFLATPVYLPSRSEQVRILDWLAKTAARTAKLAERQRQQARRVEELRTRLMADVVTGKVDVREAAAALPEAEPLIGETA